MSISAVARLSQFAMDVAEGLKKTGQKKLSPQYLYDELGSSLFEAITLLPEYGLTRADERLLSAYAPEIAAAVGPSQSVAELGSGSGRKTRSLLNALVGRSPLGGRSKLSYSPIDISPAALAACSRELGDLAAVETVCAEWLDGLSELARKRTDQRPLLLLFLGSTIGNLERDEVVSFLRQVRSHLRPGDFLLLGADLVKDPETMLVAYDDPTGVTAAFNLNLLGRMNRELEADFDLRSFSHEVRWDDERKRIEMHLMSERNQRVHIGALDKTINFSAGETIWTESSHKFTVADLEAHAYASGFTPIENWIDDEWPFAEMLWRVTAD